MSISRAALTGPGAVRAAAVFGLSAALALSYVVTGDASSHREAPLTMSDPEIDNTDVYAFVPPDAPDTVTLVGSWSGFQEPGGGPNYFRFGDDVLYTFQIDNDGDAVPNVSYEFEFSSEVVDGSEPFLPYATGPIESIQDETWNQPQTYTVTRVEGEEREELASGVRTPPVNVGPRTTPNYEQLADEAIHELDGGRKVFAGQRDDAFWADIASIFDFGGLRPFNDVHAAELDPEEGLDTFSGFNVNSIALQVPKEDLVAEDDVIGVYSTTFRRSERVFGGGAVEDSGDWVQVSRLGSPLVNESIIPFELKDAFNALEPADDAATLSDEDGNIPVVEDPRIAETITAAYGIETPPAPRADLVSIFLTGIEGVNQPADVQPSEMLRLNTAVEPTPYDAQDRLGLLAGQDDGFPNGRRLGDDVIDITLRAVAGGTPFTPDFNQSPNNELTDGVTGNDRPFLERFPYMPTPHQGYDHAHVHSNAAGAVPADGGVETGAGGTVAGSSSPLASSSALFGLLGGAVILGAGGAAWTSRRRRAPIA
jgi:hypothetical protein